MKTSTNFFLQNGKIYIKQIFMNKFEQRWVTYEKLSAQNYKNFYLGSFTKLYHHPNVLWNNLAMTDYFKEADVSVCQWIPSSP